VRRSGEGDARLVYINWSPAEAKVVGGGGAVGGSWDSHPKERGEGGRKQRGGTKVIHAVGPSNSQRREKKDGGAVGPYIARTKGASHVGP